PLCPLCLGGSLLGSVALPLLLGQRADALAEQGDVERLLEDLAEAELDELLGGGLVLAGQADDQGRLVGRVAAEVLGDLDRLAAAEGQVDDDRVGVETFRLNPGLEAAI